MKAVHDGDVVEYPQALGYSSWADVPSFAHSLRNDNYVHRGSSGGTDSSPLQTSNIEIAPDGNVRLLGVKKHGTMLTRYTSAGEWSGFRQHGKAGSWAGGDLEVAPDGRVRLLGIKKSGTMYTRYTSAGEWSGFRQHGKAGSWAGG